MILLILIVLGLCFGSFVNALVWRIHEQSKSEHNRNNKKLSLLKGRSMCPNCRHELAALDLLPIFSWLYLGGKCRYCHKPISIQYPLVEASTAVLFVLSYVYWPLGWGAVGTAIFATWLTSIVVLESLLIYDMKWMLLPNKLVAILAGLGVLQLILRLISADNKLALLLGAFWGVIILGGLFYLLFVVSKEQWIGGGDVKLGAALGIIISDPLLAVLTLFIACLFGSLVGLPLMLMGKAGRKTRLPFGPFLIMATLIVYIFGAGFMAWYKTNFLYL